MPALRARGALDAGQLAELTRTDGATLDAVLGLLTELGWLARDEAGRHGLTPAGEKWVDEGAGETRGDEKGEADARRRLAALEVALAEGIEGYDGNDVAPNAPLGTQAALLREALDALVHDIVARYLSAQTLAAPAALPRGLVDLACLDGSLLLRTYQAVRDARPDLPPPRLLGVCADEAACRAAALTLAEVPHTLLIGRTDTRQACEALRAAATAQGLGELDGWLHLAPLGAPASLAAWREVFASGEAAADTAIEVLAPHASSEARTLGALLDFAGLAWPGAAQSLMAAAGAGLIAERPAAICYPAGTAAPRLTRNRFVARDFLIRHPVEGDLPRLRELDLASWADKLAASEDELRRRVREFTPGQLVMEREGRVIAALYSQRIASLDDARRTPVERFGELLDPRGPVAHLLGIVVAPECQGQELADRLIDFALVYFAHCDGVRTVSGITRCYGYDRTRGEPMADYIGRHTVSGTHVDPMLNFHESHGAVVREVVPGFRPDDEANQGAGVLIEYPHFRRAAGHAVVDTAVPALRRAAGGSLARAVRETIEQVLGEARVDNYGPHTPLMSMGLSSFDLAELRKRLGARLGMTLDATFLLRHGTPARLLEALREPGTTVNEASPDRPASAAATPATATATADLARSVRETIEQVLDDGRIDAYGATVPLMSMGFSSFEMTDLRRRLAARFGVALDATFLFRHGTPQQVVAALRELGA
ncbi:GNAT family N-acetyltransferase, partial [Burkholderia gladioli]|uniref:GNAT family N-acetyltransferase n=2 Tax=Burkholderia gladioli TaxID=28095 RepID=UPI003F7AFDF1